MHTDHRPPLFDQLIRGVIAQRWLVLLAVLAMAALGLYNYRHLAIDAVPDITNVQVQVNTAAPAYAPLEVEQRVTFPIETVLAGLPGLEQTRSLSRYGLSQVTAVFKEGTDLYFARQLVNQRLQEARQQLPDGLTPAMGPVSTGLGEIYMWTVDSKAGARKADGSAYTAADLREIQDWIIKPQLRNVPGVAEINTIGGYAKEYHVTPDPARLAAYRLTLQQVLTALEHNNQNAGAGYIERRGEQLLVRVPGQVQTPQQISAIVLATVDGVPVRVADVATVAIGHELRSGAATANGREVVLGTVFMLIGENSRAVAQAVGRKMTEISRTLPAGVEIVTVYDRTQLVDKAITTVRNNLLEGAALVVAVLFLFLGNLRAALITAMVIPLAMLFTFTGMVSYRVSANLMSLGALDFGIIIDGAVVIVEQCVRRLGAAQLRLARPLTRAERLEQVFEAAREVRRPLLFGQLIIMVVYLPLFTLSGVEGKMFQPMAFSVVAALLAAMLLSVTFVPAAVALFIGDRVAHSDNRIMRGASRLYQPLLDRVLANPAPVLAAAATLVLLATLLATRLGSEFAPQLNEGDLALQALRAPGTSLTESVRLQRQLELGLSAKFPEIERFFARTGTAEIAADPMPPNISDGYIMLKPQSAWPLPRKSHAELVAAIATEAERYPGNAYEFSQPIQLRFNELISGVRSDVAVKLFGDDDAVLAATAQRIAASLARLAGASDVNVEQSGGLTTLNVDIERDHIARYGLALDDVQQTVAIATGGQVAGTLYQGDRRFPIVLRLPESLRTDLDALQRLPLALPRAGGADAGTVPLAEVATLTQLAGPNQISREDGKRRIVISANVRGRDVGSFVAEATAVVAREVVIPAGYWIRWGGSFEQLQSALARLQLVVPLALGLVLLLLFMMFNNIKHGLLVLTGIPFAVSGGIVALWLRGMPLSMSAVVGLIALSGVAVLNGLVMLAHINQLQIGMALDAAVRRGALDRLRPVLMTALVAALGFVPMALGSGTGAEVQRPLATVVIGGIVSSTLLTLLLLPLLYRWAHCRDGLCRNGLRPN